MAEQDLMSAVRLLITYGADQQTYRQIDRMSRTINPGDLVSWHIYQPDIPARVATLLSLQGVDPQSDQADRLADKARVASHNWYSAARQVMSYANDDQKAQLQDGIRNGDIGPIRDALTSMGKPGLVERVVGAGLSGIGELGNIHSPLDDKIPGVNEVDNTLRGAVRTTAIAANTPLQAIQGAVRTSRLGGFSDTVGAGNPLDMARQTFKEVSSQTQAGQAIGQLTRGERVDVGSGLLPDQQSTTATAAADAARRYSPYLIGGHAFTLGRAFAQGVGQQPGSDIFNALSGTVDAGTALALDPANYALSAFSKSREAGKVFAGIGDTLTPEQAAAGLQLSPKPGVNGIGFENFSASAKGQNTWRFFADNKDFQTAFHITRNVPLSLAAVDANTPEEVTNAFRSAVQNGYTRVPQVPGFGYTIRRSLSDNFRIFNDIPVGTSASQPEHLVQQFINDMHGAKVPANLIDEHAYNIAKAVNQSAPYVGLVPAMGEARAASAMSIMLRNNVPEDVANQALPLASRAHEVINPDGTIQEVARHLSVPEISRNLRDSMIRSEFVKQGVDPDIASAAVGILKRSSQPFPAQVERLTTLGITEDRIPGLQAIARDPTLAANADKYAYQADQAARITRIFNDSPTQLRGYLTDDLGNNINPWLEVNGVKAQGPSPVRQIDFLSPDTHIPMGDQHGIKQMTGLLRGVYRFADVTTNTKFTDAIKTAAEDNWGNAAVETAKQLGAHTVETLDATHMFLRYAMSHYWTPAMLFRGGWVEKVLADSQAAMGVNDLDSLISAHPFRAIGSILGRKTLGLGQTAAEEALNNPLDEYALTLQRFGGRRIPADATSLMNYTTQFAADHPQFYNKWASRFVRLNSNQMDKAIAQLGVDGATEKFWPAETGPGSLVNDMLKDPRVAQTWTDQSKFRDYLQILAEDQARLTRGHPDLLQVLKDGKFGQRQLADETAGPGGTFAGGATAGQPLLDRKGNISSAFTTWLRRYDPPPSVIGEDVAATARRTSRWDQGMSHVSDALMAGPIRKLTLNPAFNAGYWSHQIRTMSLLPEADQQALLHIAAGGDTLDTVDAGKNWLFNKIASKIAPTAQPQSVQDALASEAAKGTGDLTLDQAHHLAKAHALETIDNIAHNLSRHNQFFDTYKLLFPFGDAYRLIMQRWGENFLTHPEALRRVQQAYQGATSSGFFYKNAQGDEVFAFPGLTQAASLLGITPATFTAHPKDLSMGLAGGGLPGFGPVPQIASKYLIPDTPTFDQVHRLIDPYGSPEDKQAGLFSNIVQASTPAWARYAGQVTGWLKTPTAARQYASTVGSILQYKMSTGDYGQSPEEQRRLLADSKDAAKTFFAMRAINSFSLPISTTPEFNVQDANGHIHTVSQLSDELNKLSHGDPVMAAKFGVHPADATFDSAPLIMIKAYGENAIRFLLAGKTRPNVSGLPDTVQGDQWLRRNQALKAIAPDVYGYFAPVKGKYDPAVIGAQTARGEREQVTPEQLVQISNNRLATARYNHQKTLIDAQVAAYSTGSHAHAVAQAQATAALQTLRDDLTAKYPGFRNPIGVPSRATVDQQIVEIRQVVGQRSLQNNPVAKAVKEYLVRRDSLEADAKAAGITNWWTSPRAANGVAALSALQEELKKKYPDSARIFDGLFARDVGG